MVAILEDWLEKSSLGRRSLSWNRRLLLLLRLAASMVSDMLFQVSRWVDWWAEEGGGDRKLEGINTTGASMKHLHTYSAIP